MPPSPLTSLVPLDFLFRRLTRKSPRPDFDFLSIGGEVPLRVVVNRRARRYILRLLPDGSLRVTVPRRGTEAEARRFVARQADWIRRQLARRTAEPARPPETWQEGSSIYYRGEMVRIDAMPGGVPGSYRLGAEAIDLGPVTGPDLRPAMERALWRCAAKELPARVQSVAAGQGLSVVRVTVRNQRTRWGSCSRRGTISLNWRLIQAPSFVSDYVILHELMHLRQMNHSTRFWSEVGRAFPDYTKAERWLKDHSNLLR